MVTAATHQARWIRGRAAGDGRGHEGRLEVGARGRRGRSRSIRGEIRPLRPLSLARGPAPTYLESMGWSLNEGAVVLLIVLVDLLLVDPRPATARARRARHSLAIGRAAPGRVAPRRPGSVRPAPDRGDRRRRPTTRTALPPHQERRLVRQVRGRPQRVRPASWARAVTRSASPTCSASSGPARSSTPSGSGWSGSLQHLGHAPRRRGLTHRQTARGRRLRLAARARPRAGRRCRSSRRRCGRAGSERSSARVAAASARGSPASSSVSVVELLVAAASRRSPGGRGSARARTPSMPRPRSTWSGWAQLTRK